MMKGDSRMMLGRSFLALLLAPALLAAGPRQDAEAIDSLIRQLGADRITDREEASRRLLAIGKPARPALERAAEGSTESAAGARAVIDRIDRLPECLIDSLGRRVNARGSDYHRLLRDLSAWVRETCKGKDWAPIEAALKTAGCLRTSSWRSDGWEAAKRREARFDYVLLKDGFTMPGGLKHDLYGEFYVSIVVDPAKRTRVEITGIEVGLRATFGERLADVKERALYPRDSVLDRFLRKENDPHDGAMKLPILDSIEIYYGLIRDRHAEELGRGFHIQLKALSESRDRKFSSSYTVSSGLDPPESRDGATITAGFKSEDSLGTILWHGGHGSGPSFCDLEIVRKGWVEPTRASKRDVEEPIAYSLPDLDALPADTRELIVDMPDLRDEDLARLERLEGLRYLDLTDCGNLAGRGLGSVAGLRDLADLTLAGEKLEDDGLKHLSRLPALKRLTIYDAENLTPAGFRHLGRIASLRFLCVYGCRHLTDSCIEELAALTELKDLELGGPHDSSGDWGLRPMARIKSLERIEAWRPGRVLETDVAALARMPALREAHFYEVPFTNEALAALGASRSIEVVGVRGAKGITIDGVKQALKSPSLKRFVANDCPGVRKASEEYSEGEFRFKFTDRRSRQD